MKVTLLKSIALLVVLVTGAAASTHIHHTLVLNDTVTPMYGIIDVTGPNGGAQPPSTQHVTIGTGGVVDFRLVGCPGCKYTAIYNLTNSVGVKTQQFQETWIVPDTTSTLTIPMLWGGSAAPYFLVSREQINPAGLLPGQMWLWDGNSFVAMYPANSSIAGMLDPGGNSVPYRDSLNHTRPVTGDPTDCVRVNGTAGPCLPSGALDTVLQGGGAGQLPTYVPLISCGDSSHALAYSTSTHTWSCQLIEGAGGSGGLLDPGGNGLMSRTSLNATVNRTLTGTSNLVTVTNGDGVSGNPTFSVGANVARLDQGNAFAAGAQDLSAAASFRLPTSSGTTDLTLNGHLKYDTASHALKYFANGSVKALAAADAAMTVNGQSCALGSSCTVTDATKVPTALIPNTAPSAGQILAGNAGGTAYAPVSISGSCTMSSTGVISCSGSLNDFVTTKTSGTVVSVTSGTYRYGTNVAKLTGPFTFTLQTVPISSIDIGSTQTRIHTSTAITNLVDGQAINVQLVGTGAGCAAGTGVFVAAADTTTSFWITADTSGGCSLASGTAGAQTGGQAIIFTNTAGQIEMSISASMGALLSAAGAGAVVSQTSTGTFPAGSVPIATVTIAAGAFDTVTDNRAFLSNMSVESGAGIDVTMVGGQAQVATASNIPKTDAPSTWVNSVDMKGTTKSIPWRTGSGSPNARDNCSSIGEAYARTDSPALCLCITPGSPGTWVCSAFTGVPADAMTWNSVPMTFNGVLMTWN